MSEYSLQNTMTLFTLPREDLIDRSLTNPLSGSLARVETTPRLPSERTTMLPPSTMFLWRVYLFLLCLKAVRHAARPSFHQRPLSSTLLSSMSKSTSCLSDVPRYYLAFHP